MKTTECRSTQREIDAIELNQPLSAESRAHISDCASCRELFDHGSSLRTLVASLEPVGAPANFDMRLRARLAAEKEPKSVWINFWRQTPGVPAIALAFSLLVIGAFAIYLRPAGTQQVAGTREPAAPSAGTTGGISSGTTVQNSEPLNGTQVTGGENGIIPAADQQGTPAGSRRLGKSAVELAAGTKGSGIASREFSLLPAGSIKREEDGTATSPVVSLSAPVQPVVVSMRDDHGATRTISLPPVSFGSQRLIQPGYQSASLASSAKGAW